MRWSTIAKIMRRGPVSTQHIPYANSNLTMILASGLGGNSKTSVIVCASQDNEHSSETINAFKFGQSCRQVSKTVRTQSDMLKTLERIGPPILPHANCEFATMKSGSFKR